MLNQPPAATPDQPSQPQPQPQLQPPPPPPPSPPPHQPAGSNQLPAAGAQPARAFALGWHLAELYNYRTLPRGLTAVRTAVPPPSLPGLGALSQAQRAKVLVDQIELELPRVWSSSTTLPAFDDIRAGLDAADTGPDLLWLIYDRHTALLEALSAQDFRLGKAYGLGRAVAETVLLPHWKIPGSFTTQFDPYRVQTIVTWLSDLKSALPAHSGIAVQAGLEAWSGWVAGKPDAVPDGTATAGQRPSPWNNPKEGARITGLLNTQGALWRGLLSGEKDALSILQVDSYVAAVRAMTSRLTELALKFLWSPIGVVLAVVTLVALAVLGWLLVHGGATQITGALIAALGALGITAGSATAAVKKALVQAEQPLWDAEVGAAIVAASLLTPETPGDNRVGRQILKSVDFHAVEQGEENAAVVAAQGIIQARH